MDPEETKTDCERTLRNLTPKSTILRPGRRKRLLALLQNDPKSIQ
jgi:hypothetical protein